VQYKILEIYDATGNLVSIQENSNNASVASIDIRNLDRGIYFIKIIEQGNAVYSIKKVVKQ
jgi:hypothetical protein